MDLKITLNLQNGNLLCKVLANSVLIIAEVLPIKGKAIKSCFLGTVVKVGLTTNNFFINLQIQESINLLE